MTEETTKLSHDWKANIPESVRSWDEFKNSETSEQFYEQMANHRKHLGQSIRIPSEDAGQESWDKFHDKILNKVPNLMRKPEDEAAMANIYKQLGQPDSADDYKLGELAEGVQVPEAALVSLRELAHKNNLSQKQYKSLADQLLVDHNSQLDNMDNATKAERAKLHKEWGDAYEQRVAAVKKVAEASGAPAGLMESIDAGAIDADTMLWLHGMAKNMGEGSPMAGVEQNILTPLDVQCKIDDIMNNKDHAYWNGSHPRHAQAVEQMLDYRRKLATI